VSRPAARPGFVATASSASAYADPAVSEPEYRDHAPTQSDPEVVGPGTQPRAFRES